MPKVYIDNIDPFFIFKWFYNIVNFDCGDGAAVICCGNMEEAYQFFVEWAKEEKMRLHEKTDRWSQEINGETINFISNHDSNENYMFADKEVELSFGDTSFIIKEDCPPMFSNFTLRKV